MSWTGKSYRDSRFLEHGRHAVHPDADIIMVVAVEAGLLWFVRSRCEHGYLVNKLFQGRSLIYHAVCRPHLSKLNVRQSSKEEKLRVVKFLFEHGAQPCEEDELQELLGKHARPEYRKRKREEAKKETEQIYMRWERRVDKREKDEERRKNKRRKVADLQRKARERRDAKRRKAEEH